MKLQKNTSIENLDNIDFGQGKKLPDELLHVKWPGGIRLKLYEACGCYHLTIEKDRTIFQHQTFRYINENLSWFIEKWAKDIRDGKYKNKKTKDEQIHEILKRRNLYSCMNNTKWKAFRMAMINSTSI